MIGLSGYMALRRIWGKFRRRTGVLNAGGPRLAAGLPQLNLRIRVALQALTYDSCPENSDAKTDSTARGKNPHRGSRAYQVLKRTSRLALSAESVLPAVCDRTSRASQPLRARTLRPGMASTLAMAPTARCGGQALRRAAVCLGSVSPIDAPVSEIRPAG